MNVSSVSSVSNNYNANNLNKVNNGPSFGALKPDATRVLTKAINAANLDSKSQITALEQVKKLAEKTINSDVLDISARGQALDFVDKTTGGVLRQDVGIGRIVSVDKILGSKSGQSSITVAGGKELDGAPNNFNKDKLIGMGFKEISDNIFKTSLENFINVLSNLFDTQEAKITAKLGQ